MLRLIGSMQGSDSSVYASTPPQPDEFSADDDPLSWDAGGWEQSRIRLNRGEIRWYTFRIPDKRRPVLVLTRNEVLNSLNEIIVVPATRPIRELETEVIVTEDDGMPASCALNFDHGTTGLAHILVCS